MGTTHVQYILDHVSSVLDCNTYDAICKKMLIYLPILSENVPCPNLWTRVFVKTSPKRSYSVIENERFGLVFAKTVSIISGTYLLMRTGLKNSETFYFKMDALAHFNVQYIPIYAANRLQLDIICGYANKYTISAKMAL
jgi:hypothetical protein